MRFFLECFLCTGFRLEIPCRVCLSSSERLKTRWCFPEETIFGAILLDIGRINKVWSGSLIIPVWIVKTKKKIYFSFVLFWLITKPYKEEDFYVLQSIINYTQQKSKDRRRYSKRKLCSESLYLNSPMCFSIYIT